nr:RsmD family RNA methyltransferase [Polynucleobacter necessarius]
MLEKDKKACANFSVNPALLQSSPATGIVEILQRDSLEFLKQQADRSSNLIFIDPPFQDASLLDKAVIKKAGRVCDDAAGAVFMWNFPLAERAKK